MCLAASALLRELRSSNNNNPEGEETSMQRVQWQKVREGHEAEDRRRNETLAERVLSDPACDDFCIALDQVGFRIVGPNGEKWTMLDRRMLTPSWAVSVDEAERDARAGAAVAVEAERRRPAHVPGQRPLSRF
jgi:hypothetical protein